MIADRRKFVTPPPDIEAELDAKAILVPSKERVIRI